MHTLYFTNGDEIEVKSLSLIEIKRYANGLWLEQDGFWIYGQNESASSKEAVLDLITEVSNFNYQIKAIQALRKANAMKSMIINVALMALGLIAVASTFYKKF